MKTPYEIVYINAIGLLTRSALASTSELSNMFRDSYFSYLEYCGWSEEEFDSETLKKIDGAWTPNYN